SSIALLGKNSGSIGGSLISKYIGVFNDCDIPHIDLEKVKNVIKIMQKLASDNLVLSAHDISTGGLAIALFEMAYKNKIGFEVNLNEDLEDYFLFTEEKPRLLIEIKDEDIERIEDIANDCSVEINIVGKTNSNNICKINNKDKNILKFDIHSVSKIFEESFETYLNAN
ncbi:MAG: AIR synthase-related protein, partial [Deferribacterota bacterium]|nr:AIR synthase-related protein [Deferribacterota bacterium]